MAGFLETLFGGGAERDAAGRAQELTRIYQGQSLGALQSAYDQGTGYLKQGISAYDPLASLGNRYNAAGDLWMGALGVNGAQGRQAANNAFETTPGFTIAQKNAEDAIARRRSISGGYDAGQTDLDLGNQISGMLYDKQYAPWMQGLQSAAGMGGQYTAGAAAGQAGGYGNLASLAQQFGQNQTGVYGNVAQNNIAASNQQAAGEAQGARNLLGAGLGLASMATGGAGGGLLGSAVSGAGNAIGSMLAPRGGFTGFTSFNR